MAGQLTIGNYVDVYAPGGPVQVRCPGCGHWIPRVPAAALPRLSQGAHIKAEPLACACAHGAGLATGAGNPLPVSCDCRAVFRLQAAGTSGRYQIAEVLYRERDVLAGHLPGQAGPGPAAPIHLFHAGDDDDVTSEQETRLLLPVAVAPVSQESVGVYDETLQEQEVALSPLSRAELDALRARAWRLFVEASPDMGGANQPRQDLDHIEPQALELVEGMAARGEMPLDPVVAPRYFYNPEGPDLHEDWPNGRPDAGVNFASEEILHQWEQRGYLSRLEVSPELHERIERAVSPEDLQAIADEVEAAHAGYRGLVTLWKHRHLVGPWRLKTPEQLEAEGVPREMQHVLWEWAIPQFTDPGTEGPSHRGTMAVRRGNETEAYRVALRLPDGALVAWARDQLPDFFAVRWRPFPTQAPSAKERPTTRAGREAYNAARAAYRDAVQELRSHLDVRIARHELHALQDTAAALEQIAQVPAPAVSVSTDSIATVDPTRGLPDTIPSDAAKPKRVRPATKKKTPTAAKKKPGVKRRAAAATRASTARHP